MLPETWFDLEDQGDGWWSFDLPQSLARLDNHIYGGTAVALSVVAMETTTGRPCVWSTAQFTGTCPAGARLDIHAEVLAHGRVVSQIRVSGYDRGQLVWCAFGACAEQERPAELEVQSGSMPKVLGPDEGRELMLPNRLSPTLLRGGRRGILDTLDMRDARKADGVLAHDPMLVWARLRERPMTRTALCLVADIVPVAVARAGGREGAGTSLDNTMRFGAPPFGEWVLIEFEPYLAYGGCSHGGAWLWSEDGTLVAIASQTARVFVMDGTVSQPFETGKTHSRPSGHSPPRPSA